MERKARARAITRAGGRARVRERIMTSASAGARVIA
jgi:hypothetical protein